MVACGGLGAGGASLGWKVLVTRNVLCNTHKERRTQHMAL